MSHKNKKPGFSGELVGIIPAAGTASRLGQLPCSKELIPVGFHKMREGYQLQPKAISHYKQDRFCPGTRIPIYHPDKIRETKPDYVLILSQNLKDEIMEQMKFIREWGYRWTDESFIGGEGVRPKKQSIFCIADGLHSAIKLIEMVKPYE